MLIVSKSLNENNTRNNQAVQGTMPAPEGWSEIPAALEEKAAEYLPWLGLTYDENGEITDVYGLEHEEPTEPEPVVDPLENFALDIAEQIIDLQAQVDTLALGE